MTRNPSYILREWQVRAALAGRLKAIVVPMKERPNGWVEWHEATSTWQDWWDVERGDGKVDQDSQTVCCPYLPGDVLALKEAWCGPVLIADGTDLVEQVFYKATDDQRCNYRGDLVHWKPAQHMPRNLCRIFGPVKDVRPVRVWEMSDNEAKSLGVRGKDEPYQGVGDMPLDRLEHHWQSRHGKKYPWRDNPWAWYLEFKRLTDWETP